MHFASGSLLFKYR